jgi:MFS family permease
VIQYYQTILYKSLGIDPKTILALAGVYGTCAFVSNCITTRFLLDQWGRRKMILAGLSSVILIEIYAAVMQREFQNTDNQVGKGFAILGIYLFVVCYCQSSSSNYVSDFSPFLPASSIIAFPLTLSRRTTQFYYLVVWRGSVASCFEIKGYGPRRR